MTDTTQAARPVPPVDLPAGAVCALTPTGRLSDGDVREIERFRALLADKTAVMAEYADTLGPITPTHAYAALHPIPAQHADDPDLVRLWRERAGRLRELYRAYDADGYEADPGEGPEPCGGDHGTCARCGGGIRYQACPTGGWWIHDAHPADGHDAELGGPA